MAESRRIVLWCLGLATLAGVVAAARVEEEAAEPPPRKARPAAPGVERGARAASELRPGDPAPSVLALERLVRAPFDASVAARIALAWEPPPPPPPASKTRAELHPPAPPPPKPPALPFKVIGRFSDGLASAAIVQSGPATLVLRKGDVVERNYRIDDVNDKEVMLTYLPLQAAQTLDLGEAR